MITPTAPVILGPIMPYSFNYIQSAENLKVIYSSSNLVGEKLSLNLPMEALPPPEEPPAVQEFHPNESRRESQLS